MGTLERKSIMEVVMEVMMMVMMMITLMNLTMMKREMRGDYLEGGNFLKRLEAWHLVHIQVSLPFLFPFLNFNNSNSFFFFSPAF